jgi:uncharacterized membrane protein
VTTLKSTNPKSGKEADSELLDLSQAARYLLEEGRMVLPGMQTLFGFQLISVFSQNFSAQLSEFEQTLHLVALVVIAIAISLVMTPAAIHRQTGARHVTSKFIESSTRLLLVSMFPLLFGICIDLYLIAKIVTKSSNASLVISFLVLIIFSVLWFVYPRIGGFREAKNEGRNPSD